MNRLHPVAHSSSQFLMGEFPFSKQLVSMKQTFRPRGHGHYRCRNPQPRSAITAGALRHTEHAPPRCLEFHGDAEKSNSEFGATENHIQWCRKGLHKDRESLSLLWFFNDRLLKIAIYRKYIGVFQREPAAKNFKLPIKLNYKGLFSFKTAHTKLTNKPNFLRLFLGSLLWNLWLATLNTGSLHPA